MSASSTAVAQIVWEPPARINSESLPFRQSTNDWPSIATNGEGVWLCLWWSGHAPVAEDPPCVGNILAVRSTDNGATWSVPVTVNCDLETDPPPGGGGSFPVMGLGEDGVWLTLWLRPDSSAFGYSRSTDDGVTWEPSRDASPPPELDTFARQVRPVLATDGHSNWILAWTSRGDFNGQFGDDKDILSIRSTDNGATWGPPAAINAHAMTDDPDLLESIDAHPAVASDGTGLWIAVWVSLHQPPGPELGRDPDLLFSRSTDAGATWSPAAVLDLNAFVDVLPQGGEVFQPALAADGEGTWVAVWSSKENLGDIGTDSDIFTSRSTDDGITWSRGKVLNQTATTDHLLGALNDDDENPKIVTDGVGNWIVSWISDANLGEAVSSPPDLLFSLSTDDGQTWSFPSHVNATAGPFRRAEGPGLSLATDGEGLWIAAWQSMELITRRQGFDPDIFFSRGRVRDNHVRPWLRYH